MRLKKIYFLDVKHKEKINENAYETSRKYFDAEKITMIFMMRF